MHRITRIIDGDSIEVDGGTNIRVAGVDVVGKAANDAAKSYMEDNWLHAQVELYDDPAQGKKTVHGEMVKVVVSHGRLLRDELSVFGLLLKY
jgi:hypothetical protein